MSTESESVKYIAKKLGVRFKSPALVLVYEDLTTKKLHRRTMPVRGMFKNSSASRLAADIKDRHKDFLESVPAVRIEKLLRIIQENMKGNVLDLSLNVVETEFSVNPEEDLNKLDDESLKRKKEIMDQTFEMNRKKPGDTDYQYDIQVDFDQDPGPVETSEWDLDDNDDEF
ncbi:centrosomal protein of 19 kDa-like [Limulus polyphemus]|uniref:Centrosomal protein of 19 kDa n=1 Tax=Limulus polyphemus TaxID=6850 RepID=A0ABM1BDT4_LIMPO|nr:centrosomal protein of 19 kDa-like [Limulus polyphemus]